MSLTDSAVRTAKPRPKSYKLSDAKGLYLQVEPNGSKLWRLKYRFLGTEKRLSFGAYPEVTLALARERQIDARRLLGNGIDPGEFKKQAKRSAVVASVNTFEAVTREWFTKFSGGWAEGHSSKVLLRLENDLFPWLGSRPIMAIESNELLATIRRIEARGALDSAHRCLGYCGQVFRYAIATGRINRNPAADLRGSLPPAKGGHFASITDPNKVGALLRSIHGYEGTLVTRCALRLAPLTFVRPGELRTAEWANIDIDAAEWRIPAERMKMREGLIVPLSRQSLAIVRELQPSTGRGRYLFPSLQSVARPMSENTINGALRRLGYAGDEMTGHGFRAMARTILDEVLEFRVEWIEHQLAHEVKDPNGRAYNRTAFLAGRREMMQRWADYLDQLRTTDPINVESKNVREAA
ncbi:MAG: integrase arm-type DNA-binding domain-containing protein [Proteobacteria bacterium]|nr:integrase arm-type DNA-binding domain-containing protein [Pseudomonadota bacterium]